MSVTVRRNAVCDAIDVNLILARRIKKLNFEIDSVPYLPNGTGLRMIKVSNKSYERLMEEIHGGNSGPMPTLAARPELEVLTVGVIPQLKSTVLPKLVPVATGEDPNIPPEDERKVEAELSDNLDGEPEEPESSASEAEGQARKDKKKLSKGKAKKAPVLKKKKKKKRFDVRNRDASEEVDGRGTDIIYDDRKRLFILSDRSEDRLLMSLKINERATNIIDRSIFRVNHSDYCVNSKLKQKLWRRFLREFIGFYNFRPLNNLLLILFVSLHIFIHTAPKLDNAERMAEINPRYQKFLKAEYKRKELALNANRIWSAEELSSSDSESDFDDEDDDDDGDDENRRSTTSKVKGTKPTLKGMKATGTGGGGKRK